MVNNVIGMVNYVIAARPSLLNYVIADRAGSNRRPSAFQGSEYNQVRATASTARAPHVPYQCLATMDFESRAAAPCAASSDSVACNVKVK